MQCNITRHFLAALCGATENSIARTGATKPIAIQRAAKVNSNALRQSFVFCKTGAVTGMLVC